MVKYREILRLDSIGISRRNIAFSCGCAPSTVQTVLQRSKSKGIEWPLPEEMTDTAIRNALYPPKGKADSNKADIPHEHVAQELERRGMTMMLLWNEYCESALAAGKEPYQYSSFCQHHHSWAVANDVTMHIDHKPGEKMQVDWVGDTMSVCDPDTGEVLKVYVFTACLPYSSRIYAQGFYRMDIEAWITAHVRAFTFFGGSTPLIVPDNLKTGIIKNTTDELIINEQYRRMCEHYHCAVVPTRVVKPRDKGAVEMSVGVVERQAVAALRNQVFFSLEGLNAALVDKVAAINARPFQKREGGRDSVFFAKEKDRLIPLPPKPYQMTERKRTTVQMNYHVYFDGAYYSVPFSYVKREVDITATSSLVTVACDGQRIASHARNHGPKGSYVTDVSHMPDTHRDYVEWNGDRFRKWASSIGPSTGAVIDAVLKSRQVEQQSYRSCHGVLALARKHGNEMLEEACTKALVYSPRPSYKTVKSIIGKLVADKPEDPDEHAYLRGSDYYSKMEEGE